MYRLTEEGKEYLRNRLPEMNLADMLSKSPGSVLSMKEARDGVENFNIALQWAKKNGWVRLEKGKIILARKPDNVPEQKALEKIEKGTDVSGRMLSVLLRRKLVEKEKARKAEKLLGREINALTPSLIKTGLWRKAKLRPYNVSARGRRMYPGKRHPYNRFLLQVKRKLMEMGFKEMPGSLIELEFWNFDALYQAQNHPSRDWTQTYTLKYPKYGSLPNPRIVSQVRQTHENGWKTGSTGWGYKWDPKKASQLMPRAHGTALSARTLASQPEIPGKYFAIVRCFRPDVIDATHGLEFNQCEGIVIDPSLTFRNLLGLLKVFAIEFAGTEKVRFYSDYYPFTEPSVQLSAKHPEMGWIELGGAGIFREELTLPLGIKEPVIAWGLGIDRLAMFKLGINDIRDMFSRNLDWLRNQVVL